MKSRIQHGKAARSRRSHRQSQWLVASGISLCGALAASPALAQTAAVPAPAAAASAPTALGDVVVTSRRRAERLQDVPLSITAITSKQIEDSGAKSLLDLAKLVPGLTYSSAGSEANVNITIRGLSDLSGGGGDPNVAVFIDGVYQANRSAISLGLMDLERVEFVKGPVSALYGRNAYAGAINYVTKKPLDQFEASITAGIATKGGRTAKGSIGGAIQPGVLDFRLVVGHDESAGTYKDSVTGLSAGGYRKDDGALSLSLTPAPGVSVIATAYYGDDYFGAQSIAYMDNNCGALNTAGVNAIANNFTGAFSQYCGKLNPTQHAIEVAYMNPSANQGGNTRRVNAETLRVGWDFGLGDASALFGYNKVRDYRYADFTGHRDGIPFVTAPNPPGAIYNLKELFGADTNNADRSIELRVSTKQDQPLRGSAGFYYFNATSTGTTLIGADGSTLPAGVTLPAGSTGSLFLTRDGSYSTSNFTQANFTDKIVSPFASVEYDVIPALTLQGEARHTGETKSFQVLRNAFIANTVLPATGTNVGSADYSFSNYRGSARYKLDSETMVYASAANGTKAGGFNQRTTSLVDISFDPETSVTYEVGAKASFLEKKVQLGVALYHQKSKDVQVSGPSSDPTNLGLVTKNLASTRSTGIDFDFALVPLRGVTVNGGIGYSNPKISSGSYDYGNAAACLTVANLNCAGRVVSVYQPLQNISKNAVDLNGLQAPLASKVTFSAGAQYDGILTSKLNWFGRADFRYESKKYTQPIGFNYIGSRKVVNLNAGISADKFKLTAYVRNLTNDKTPDAAAPNGLINGGVTPWVAYLPAQRIYGLTGTYDF